MIVFFPIQKQQRTFIRAGSVKVHRVDDPNTTLSIRTEEVRQLWESWVDNLPSTAQTSEGNGQEEATYYVPVPVNKWTFDQVLLKSAWLRQHRRPSHINGDGVDDSAWAMAKQQKWSEAICAPAARIVNKDLYEKSLSPKSFITRKRRKFKSPGKVTVRRIPTDKAEQPPAKLLARNGHFAAKQPQESDKTSLLHRNDDSNNSSNTCCCRVM